MLSKKTCSAKKQCLPLCKDKSNFFYVKCNYCKIYHGHTLSVIDFLSKNVLEKKFAAFGGKNVSFFSQNLAKKLGKVVVIKNLDAGW